MALYGMLYIMSITSFENVLLGDNLSGASLPVSPGSCMGAATALAPKIPVRVVAYVHNSA